MRSFAACCVLRVRSCLFSLIHVFFVGKFLAESLCRVGVWLGFGTASGTGTGSCVWMPLPGACLDGDVADLCGVLVQVVGILVP